MPRPLPLFNSDRVARATGDLRPPLVALTGTGLQSAGPVASDFIATDTVLTAAFADGSLRGFATSDLSEIWAVPLPEGQIPSRHHGAPIMSGDVIVLQSGGHWQCHAPDTGAQTESFEAAPVSLRRAVTMGSGILCTWWQNDTANLGLFDLPQRRFSWRHPIEGSANAPLTLCNGVAALALSDTVLGGFDTATGAEIWRCDIADIGVVQGPFALASGVIGGWPLRVGNLFVLPVHAGHWLGLDPATGTIRWRCHLEVNPPGTATCVGAHVICLCEGHATAFDPANGARLWSKSWKDHGFGPYGAPVASGGYLWAVGARDGRVLALDATYGTPAWQGPAGDLTPPDRPPMILSDRLLTADNDGLVRLFAASN